MDNLKKVFSKIPYIFPVQSLTGKMPLEIPDFTREDLAKLIHELDFKVGIEIGVRGGDYSEILCKHNPQLKLYGVDPYIPLKGYRDITKQTTFDKFELEARGKLAPYMNRVPAYEFLKVTSEQAMTMFEDNSLDFVYLDGDHSFEEVTKDISGWLKKLKPGGIISGDDYVKHKGEAKIHVYYVVQGFTQAYNIRPWFICGRWGAEEGEKRDHGRSWFWVKQ